MKETMIERVAKEIEPNAFRQFWSLRDHCLRSGDTPEEALRVAQWAHGSDIDAAMALARAAIVLLQSSIDSDEFMAAVSQQAYDGRFARSGETYPVLRNHLRAFFDATLHEKEGSE